MGKFFNSSVIKGTLILTIFGFLGKALGAVFRIGLSSIIGSFGMGIYQLVFPLLVFFIVFSSEGFSLGLTIKTAEDKGGQKRRAYFKFSSLWCLLFAGVSAVLISLFSGVLSRLQGERVEPYLYIIVSVGIIIISLLSILKAGIRGQENFKLYSVSEVVEDLFKVILGLILGYLFLPYGVMSAVAGVLAGIILSSLVTIIILVALKPKSSRHQLPSIGLTLEEKKSYLKFSLLAMGSALVVPAVQFIESTIIIDLLTASGATAIDATKLYGLSRGSVSAIINLPFFVLTSFEVLLLPNLARAKSGGIYFKKTSASLFLSIFISLPFVLLFVIFPNEVVGLLYGNGLTASELVISAILLRIGAVGIVFSSISTILSVILNSNDKVFAPFWASVIAGVSKIIALIFLVPRLSIYGAEISSVLFSSVYCLVSLICSLKYKIFTKPQNVIWLTLGWGVIFFCVYLLYQTLSGVIDSGVLACMISFGAVGAVLLILILFIFLLSKQKFIGFIKKTLGIE